MLEKQKKELNYEKPNLETGPPNPKALKRTFNNNNEPIRLKVTLSIKKIHNKIISCIEIVLLGVLIVKRYGYN